MAKSKITLLVAAALLLVLVPAPGASADTAFAEDWETGTDGWTQSGLGGSIVCGDPTRGCSYAIDAACCSMWTTMTHDVNIPLDGGLALDFDLMATSLWGDMDSDIRLGFDDGSVLYETTNWYNNGLGLVTDSDSDQAYTYYDAAGEWNHLRLLLSGDEHLAQAQHLDENGTVIAASRVLPFSASATTITSIAIRGINWGTSGGPLHYDDLSLAPSDACFAPLLRIDGPWFAPIGEPTEFVVESQDVACDPIVDWSVSFGEGATQGGQGLPPGSVSHTYGSTGWFDVVIVANLQSGASVTSSLWIDVYDPCAYPLVRMLAPFESRVHTNATIDLTYWNYEYCAEPTSWALDLGDGTSVGGAGTPPAKVTHAFTTKGHHYLTFNVTLDGRNFSAFRSVLVYDIAIQHVNGTVLANAHPVELSDSGIIRLDTPGAYGSRLRLTYSSPLVVADMDAIFYDGQGKRMASQPCRILVSAENCVVPLGATYVRLTSDGAQITWRLEHEYRI